MANIFLRISVLFDCYYYSKESSVFILYGAIFYAAFGVPEPPRGAVPIKLGYEKKLFIARVFPPPN